MCAEMTSFKFHPAMLLASSLHRQLDAKRIIVCFLSSYCCKNIFNNFSESDLSFCHIWSKLSHFESGEQSYPYRFYTCWIHVLWLVVRSATQLLQLYKVHMHRGVFFQGSMQVFGCSKFRAICGQCI